MIRTISNPKPFKTAGFTMVEIMVALVILAVGLLGMAGMTMVVMRGNRGAEDLANATNVCQQKIEELKDITWVELGNATSASTVDAQVNQGLQDQGMVQENNLNSQGLTRAALFTQQSAITGSACSTSSDTSGTPCEKYLNQAGPYKYSRTFVVCNGANYTGPPSVPPVNSTTNLTGYDPTGKPSGEPNCLVDPSGNPGFRPSTLGCEDNDILTPGVDSPEKMIKILCTWRAKEGRCSYVNFEALRMNNL